MFVKLTAVVAVIVAAELGGCRAALIKVGGASGWLAGTNYTEWASHEQFYVGDWLYFVFDKAQYDVLEVNKTVYESCNSQAGFIYNVTRGGRDVFQLTQPRDYYFLCSRGYCWGGMKLAVSVQEPPSPAPGPSKSAAPAVPRPPILVLLAPAVARFFFSSSVSPAV